MKTALKRREQRPAVTASAQSARTCTQEEETLATLRVFFELLDAWDKKEKADEE